MAACGQACHRRKARALLAFSGIYMAMACRGAMDSELALSARAGGGTASGGRLRHRRLISRHACPYRTMILCARRWRAAICAARLT